MIWPHYVDTLIFIKKNSKMIISRTGIIEITHSFWKIKITCGIPFLTNRRKTVYERSIFKIYFSEIGISLLKIGRYHWETKLCETFLMYLLTEDRTNWVTDLQLSISLVPLSVYGAIAIIGAIDSNKCERNISFNSDSYKIVGSKSAHQFVWPKSNLLVFNLSKNYFKAFGYGWTSFYIFWALMYQAGDILYNIWLTVWVDSIGIFD